MSNDVILVPVTAVQPDLVTQTDVVVYVPIASKTGHGIVRIGEGLTITKNGLLSFDRSEVTIKEVAKNGLLIEPDENKRINIVLNKNDVGLDNVDNTSDLDKPVSDATRIELRRLQGLITGAEKAIVYPDYVTMVTDLNTQVTGTYELGQTILIKTRDVPDLWIYDILDNSVEYEYVDDQSIVDVLDNNGTVQMGHYVLAMMETKQLGITIDSELSDISLNPVENAVVTKELKLLTRGNNLSEGYNVRLTKSDNGVIITSMATDIVLDVPEDAEQGILTSEQVTTLLTNPDAYLILNNDVYYLNEENFGSSCLTYTSVGFINGSTVIKNITITLTTNSWVLNTTIVNDIMPVVIDAPSTATQGTLTDEQLSTLQDNDQNYILFNNEIYRLDGKQHQHGYLTYVNIEHEGNSTQIKIITITINTKGWVLSVGDNLGNVALFRRWS